MKELSTLYNVTGAFSKFAIMFQLHFQNLPLVCSYDTVRLLVAAVEVSVVLIEQYWPIENGGIIKM